MARTFFITPEAVTLEGFQAILQPTKFGYALSAIIDEDMVSKLEHDRTESLKWAESKLKNPKRSVLKPEPWEEVAENKYKAKFSWNDENRPPVVDTEGTPITDERTPLYSGSKVKLAFYQKPYILKDQTTYGTSLKLVGIQVVVTNGSAGVDTGDLGADDVAEMFGKTDGFKVSDPNVQPSEDTDDF
jgi:hypothetical protein